jgi:hypothetical protein
MGVDRSFIIRWTLLAVLLCGLSLTIPRNAGPDEPAHAIRAAALVRGDVLGSDTADGEAYRVVTVPGWLTQPNPACFAFQPEQRAGCATVEPTSGSERAVTTAGSYPVFGHLLPGVGTLLPGGARNLYAARALGVMFAAGVLAAALGRLVRRGDPNGMSAALIALTPASLFAIAVINPSGTTIAGALALIVACSDLAAGDSSASTLFVVGSAALLLPRPDGAVWFAGALVLGALAWGVGALRAAWSALRAWARIGVATAFVTAIAWPLAVRPELIEIPVRERGRALVEVVLARTSTHLDEGVGLFGWADTSVPRAVFYAWWALLAVLATKVWPQNRRGVLGLAVGIGGFVAVGWVADFVGAGNVGLVWQGRYALPLLVVAVMCAGLRVGEPVDFTSRPGAVAAAAIGIWVAAFWQAFRRWSVGASGSPFPWDWERGASFLHPSLGLVVVAGSAAGLLWTLRIAAAGTCVEREQIG